MAKDDKSDPKGKKSKAAKTDKVEKAKTVEEPPKEKASESRKIHIPSLPSVALPY